MRLRLTAAAATILLCGVALPAVAQFGPPGPPAVGVATVQRRPVTETSEFVGRVQAIDRVDIVARVTAFIQAVLSGIGMGIAGVPAAALLTAIIFMLCLAQIGPIPVLILAVIWVYWKVGTLWGTVLLIWSVLVGAIDNFIRPVLIRKGADLPLLLIFAGVIGGLVAFGIIGIFIGPVVLAVSHTLLKAWVSAGEEEVGQISAEHSDDDCLKQEVKS